MNSKNKQLGKFNINFNQSELKNIPQFQQKSYSFKDPLFQSFGNGYQSKKYVNEPIKYSKNQITNQNNNNENSEQRILDQIYQISDKFCLLKNMFKIDNPICKASTLLVNTQNKIKTEMLIESKSKNEDKDSKNLCENAKKYLTFLNVIRQEQNLIQFESISMKRNKKEYQINSEYRIQNEIYLLKKQPQFIQTKNLFKKKQSSSLSYQFKDINQQFLEESNYLTHQNHNNLNGNEFISNKKNHLSDNDHSKYLNSYQKTSQFTNISENNDKLFQNIQTPKIYNNKLNTQQGFFTPFHESNYLSNKSDDNNKFQSRKLKKYQKSPLSSAVLQTKQQKIKLNSVSRQQICNQKIQINKHNIEIRKEQKVKNKNSNSKQKNNSLNQKQKNHFSFLKTNQKTTEYSGNKTNKFMSSKLENQLNSKNLTLKVVNKTNQFEKMLKMASSRIDSS